MESVSSSFCRFVLPLARSDIRCAILDRETSFVQSTANATPQPRLTTKHTKKTVPFRVFRVFRGSNKFAQTTCFLLCLLVCKPLKYLNDLWWGIYGKQDTSGKIAVFNPEDCHSLSLEKACLWTLGGATTNMRSG